MKYAFNLISPLMLLFLKFFDDIIDFSVCSPNYVLQSSRKTQRYFSYVEFPVVWSDTRTTKLVETMMEQEQQYHFVNTDLFFQKYNFSNIINFCWQMSFRRLNASGISPSGINAKGKQMAHPSNPVHVSTISRCKSTRLNLSPTTLPQVKEKILFETSSNLLLETFVAAHFRSVNIVCGFSSILFSSAKYNFLRCFCYQNLN